MIYHTYGNNKDVTERTLAAQRTPSRPMEFRTHETVTATVGNHTITLAKGAPNLLRVDGGQYEVFWSEAGAYGRMVQAIEECAGHDAFYAGKDFRKAMSEHWCNGWNEACESARSMAREWAQHEDDVRQPFDADRSMAREECLDEEYIRRGW